MIVEITNCRRNGAHRTRRAGDGREDRPALCQPRQDLLERARGSLKGSSCDSPVQPCREKYFTSLPGQIISLFPAVLARERGVSRSSRTLGAGCGGRGSVVARDVIAERHRACGRTVLLRTAKSCGPDAPMLASSLWKYPQVTVTTKRGHRGEHEGNRKTIARGMPGVFRCDRGDLLACFLFLHARLRAHRAPGIPCALIFEGPMNLHNSGAWCRENAEAYSDVIARPGAQWRTGTGRPSIPERQ
jgi:hypothetical protein